ncbi:MAG: ATP synthase F1 subunit delta [Candidatus Gastranaerophilaceae bacterium]
MKNAEQTEFKIVAYRYAKALKELCESNNVSKEDISRDLESIVSTIRSSQDLTNLIKAPNVSKSDKQNVIQKIFEGKINDITKNFILYLVEKDRFRIIENIMFEFQAELDKEHNIVQIEIVSAINIDDNAKQTIKDRLSDKLQKQVNVDWSVNPDIIAGLVFIVGDNIIDTSIKSKLQMIGRNIIK